MSEKRYNVKLTGHQPLFMHSDDVRAADTLEAWRKDPTNKRRSVKGDDRSPAWTYKSYLYSEECGSGIVCIPNRNIMSSLEPASTQFTMGRSRKSLKAATQASIFLDNPDVPLMIKRNGEWGTINRKDFADNSEPDFDAHDEQAKKLGVKLDIRRVSIGTNKHVRVRPVFNSWKLDFNIRVFDDGNFSDEIVEQMYELAGRIGGIGDWRPSSPKRPGPYGAYLSQVTPL